MPEDKTWHVFLSYPSPARAQVERLALRLEDEAHFNVYLDKWRLVPGEKFIAALGQAIGTSACCAVFIDKDGIRPWQNEEMEAALERAVTGVGQAGERPFRVISVLLPGAMRPAAGAVPSFITLRTWVDFNCPRGIDDPDAFNQLVAGIRGVEPGKPHVPPAWLTTIDVPELKRPTGIAVDGDAIIVADHEAGHVVRIANGKVVQSAKGLLRPHHLITMGETVIVCDTHHNALAFLDLDLKPRSVMSKLGEYALRRPHGLAWNYPDEFYVTDADNHRVLRVENAEVTAALGCPGGRSGFDIGEFSIPCGVAAAPDCIYVADTYNHRIQVLTRDLRALYSFGRLGHRVGEFAYPVAVATQHEWILISDGHNKRLQLWRREGESVTGRAVCVSVDLCGQWLGSPFGITFDANGRLFVADRTGGKVLRIEFDRMLTDLSAKDTTEASAHG